MIERSVPVSPHNVNVFRLEEMCDGIDEAVELTASENRGTILMGMRKDVARTFTERAGILITPMEHDRGFSVRRSDGTDFQAQNVTRMENFPPFGKPVFWKPVGVLPVLQEPGRNGAEGWNVEVDPDNVASTADLMHLVWALSRYTLKSREAKSTL